MDFTSVLNKSEPHQRTIVHLDMDYFYAQVEEIRDASLRTLPFGVSQKNSVVTCNYIARQRGVAKMMPITDAKRICPELTLVNGEDLTPYRQMSQRIYEFLINYTPFVEKLGFDENYMDVTSLVETRRDEWCCNNGYMHLPEFEGHMYPAANASLNDCSCGCAIRLAIGMQIAKEIRNELFLKLGITCCGGVSYNKLLAKLVGSCNKPNQQTVLVSTFTEQFMRDLKNLNRVTGIGQKTESLLLESGIANVEELQQCDMDFLRKKFGFETATKLKDMSFGRDTTAVRPSGKPKSIGLEDSCRPISVRTDVEERFRLLLMRLLEQVAEDGRIPICVKIMLRKYDAQKKTSHRESKQANILPSLFKAIPPTSDVNSPKVMLAEGAQDKLLKIIMRLFERIVDLTKSFNITLIGLAFSKFQQRKVGSSSIANFLIKKTDLEVQSITSLINTEVVSTNVTTSASPTPSISSANSNDETTFRSSPTTFQPSDQFYRRRATTASPVPMLVDNGSESGATNSDFSDISETEIEPSPKKGRFASLVAKRHCLRSHVYNSDASDVASPSKLRVCDLRLNSRDSEKDLTINSPSTSAASMSTAVPTATIPPAVAPSNLAIQRIRAVQPPSTLLSRLDRIDRIDTCRSFFTRQLSVSSSAASSPLASPMDDSITPTTIHMTKVETSISTSPIIMPVNNLSNNTTNIPYPDDVDPEVFKVLPIDVQTELITSWRHSLAAAVVSEETSKVVQARSSVNSTVAAATATANGTSKNNLYRYFLRNK